MRSRKKTTAYGHGRIRETAIRRHYDTLFAEGLQRASLDRQKAKASKVYDEGLVVFRMGICRGKDHEGLQR